MGTPGFFEGLAQRQALEKLTAQDLTWPAGAPSLAYSANATTKATARIPRGTLSLSLIPTTGFQSLTVTGRNTGFVYANLGSYSTSQFFSPPWSAPPDDLADFVIVTGAGQSGSLFASASPIPGFNPNPPLHATAFASLSRAVGTYIFQTPATPQPYKGLFLYIAVPAGAGTVTVSAFSTDQVSGFIGPAVIASTALAVSASVLNILRVYPGLPSVANAAANDILSANIIRIQAVVGTGTTTFSVAYDLLP